MNEPREIRLFRAALWRLIQAMSESAVDLDEIEGLGHDSPKYPGDASLASEEGDLP